MKHLLGHGVHRLCLVKLRQNKARKPEDISAAFHFWRFCELQVPKHVRVVHIPLLGVFCKNIGLFYCTLHDKCSKRNAAKLWDTTPAIAELGGYLIDSDSA